MTHRKSPGPWSEDDIVILKSYIRFPQLAKAHVRELRARFPTRSEASLRNKISLLRTEGKEKAAHHHEQARDSHYRSCQQGSEALLAAILRLIETGGAGNVIHKLPTPEERRA